VAQYSLQRAALEAVVDTPRGRQLRVYSTHLSHLADGDRAPQLDALLDIHRRAPSEGAGWCGERDDPGWTDGRPAVPMPREAVLMGDFNLAHDSPLYERVVGPWSEQYGRMTNPEGFVDCWVATGHREDEGVTCLSGSLNSGQRIDVCFASAALAPALRRAVLDIVAREDHSARSGCIACLRRRRHAARRVQGLRRGRRLRNWPRACNHSFHAKPRTQGDQR
ncbi:MAG: endonuclease/exonuclease/phosphatase family protein, partial [Alphaproteobacteria bacterium]